AAREVPRLTPVRRAPGRGGSDDPAAPAGDPGGYGAACQRARGLSQKHDRRAVVRVLSQICLFAAKCDNRVLKNQWLVSLNFPVFGNLRQNPRACRARHAGTNAWSPMMGASVINRRWGGEGM